MRTRYTLLTAVALAFLAWGCSGEGAGEEEADSAARDLSLAPAESVGTISDVAADEPEPARQPVRRPPPPPEPAVPMLKEGSVFTLYANDTLTSRHNEEGEEVSATAFDPIRDQDGNEIIPAGAVFLGTITDIAPAESPGGEGRMVIDFTRVQFDGKTYAVEAELDSLGFFMKGRGITAGDAAKVGAGAAVGAVAGRIIGGNKTGTIVGAAAGAAAGVGIMAATRDVDIILAAGAPVRLVLTAPFVKVALQDT